MSPTKSSQRLTTQEQVQLRYYTTIDARNRSGKYQQGRKVTGLVWLPATVQRSKTSRDGKNARPQLLVTTNDSRMRLFQMQTFHQVCKFKGLANESLQLAGSFSSDGKYVVAPSETGHVYIWNTTNVYRKAVEQSGEHGVYVRGGGRMSTRFRKKRDRNLAYESFMATFDEMGNDRAMPCISTAAVFAPFPTVSLAAAASEVHMLYTDLEQLANSIIVSADYTGKIRFYMRACASTDTPPK